MVSILYSVFWGSYGSWGRLLICIIPFALCGIAIVIDTIVKAFMCLEISFKNSELV